MVSAESDALSAPSVRVPPPDTRTLAMLIGSLLAVALVASIDYSVGDEIALSILYLVPVSLAATGGRNRGIIVALFAGCAWWWVEVNTKPAFSHVLIPWWNTFARTAVFVSFAVFVAELRRAKLHLEAEVQRRTSDLLEEVEQRRHLEREMAEMAAQEQARVARDLHDGVGQFLAGLAFRARVLLEDLRSQAPNQVPQAQKLVELVALANRETRRLDRMLQARAEGEDLVAALHRLVRNVQQLFEVSCAVNLPEQAPELDPLQSDTLFRIAQEALNNAIKHSEGKLINLLLHDEPDGVRLIVSDNGGGLQTYGEGSSGAGLTIMRYRAELIGAHLEIRNAEGGGCIVECRLPLHAARPMLARAT
jgi:signal transduction histidine kinase